MTPYYEADGITLFHGDCLEVEEWLAGDVLVTDPPYGMAYVSGYVPSHPIAGDGDTSARDTALHQWGERPALVFGRWSMPRPAGTRQRLIWWKRTVGAGMGDLKMPWGPAEEEIYVLGDGWTGKRVANVIPTDEQRGNPYGAAAKIGHPTPKPVGLMEHLIAYAPQGTVVDPFAGSGSTLLAARNQGRTAIGVEIEEAYCELIASRLAQGVLV